ncbi:MAG TPA: glutamine--fructose-6-phosphate transaminase (isomerizing) [Deltaproteobacteria bacterium]|nr:glutamine--fructose-6-phosphate transaminase (isomerizing) [Deltaproteobacteria bacterium]
MCGIVGYTGPRQCGEILLDGLRRLEYRGYDSAGVAVCDGGEIVIRKSEGKISRLLDLVARDPVNGTCGVGHTRWATHGRPSDDNAHPHKTGRVAVVHNGIVENHRTLKELLTAKGRNFVSETDTEVIAHLVDEYHSGGLGLEEAVRKTVAALHGSYAFLCLSEKEPGTLVGARLNCPMVVGVGEGETFLASDLPPLLSYTRNALFLEDGEIVVAGPEGLKLTDFSGSPKERPTVYIDWSPVMAEKGGYRHFMLKEIHEQPRAILDTLAGRVHPDTGEVFFDTLPLREEELRVLSRVLIVACGTSWHAGLVGKFLIEGLTRLAVEVDLGSEYRYRNPVVEKGTLCVPISQSGETADTLAGLREARRKGAFSVAICNVVSSTIARESDGVIYTHAGPEISYIHAEGYPAGEMKHGPIALIDERMPVLVLCSKGDTYGKTVSNLEEARTRGGRVIALGTEGDTDLLQKAEDVFFLPPCGPLALPILEVVPLQLLAYHMAVLKGTDVDQPRNLAKSVTVE